MHAHVRTSVHVWVRALMPACVMRMHVRLHHYAVCIGA